MQRVWITIWGEGRVFCTEVYNYETSDVTSFLCEKSLETRGSEKVRKKLQLIKLLQS
jgi:hypothetical protein